MMVIDFHVHVGDFYSLRKDIQELLRKHKQDRDFDLIKLFGNPEALADYLKGLGVIKAVLLAEEGPGTNFHVTSDFVYDFYSRSGEVGQELFVPFGNVNPNRGYDIIKSYKKSKQQGIRGYKLYPADHNYDPYSKQMLELYEYLEADDMLLMFHTGATAQDQGNSNYCNPLVFEKILQDHPKLNVIFAHAGKPDFYREAEYCAQTYENCYLDTALVDVTKLPQFFPKLEMIGHKILFASDWPVLKSLKQFICSFYSIGLPDIMVQQILYKNAAKLLKLDLTQIQNKYESAKKSLLDQQMV